MMKLRVAALCKERAIAHPHTALKKAGISKTKTTQYLKGKTNRIMLDDIEVLCNLLRCIPNELFEWTPTTKAQDYPENPLQAIAKKPPFVLEEIIKNMTVGEVKDLFAKHKEEKDK